MSKLPLHRRRRRWRKSNIVVALLLAAALCVAIRTAVAFGSVNGPDGGHDGVLAAVAGILPLVDADMDVAKLTRAILKPPKPRSHSPAKAAVGAHVDGDASSEKEKEENESVVAALINELQTSLRDMQETLSAQADDLAAAAHRRAAAAAVAAAAAKRGKGLFGANEGASAADADAAISAFLAAAAAAADASIGRRDVCIAMARDVPAARIAAFAASFREVTGGGSSGSGANGSGNSGPPTAHAPDLFLMVGKADVTPRLAELAVEHRIIVLEIPTELLEPAYLRSYHAASLRWVLADRLLSAGPNISQRHYGAVLLADARDIFFQSDPFATLVHGHDHNRGTQAARGGLQLFHAADDAAGPVGEAAAAAVRRCYGEETLAEISAFGPPLSSAIMLGRSLEVRAALRIMAEEMSSEKLRHCCEAEQEGAQDGGGYYRLGGYSGGDFAAINVLVRRGVMAAAGIRVTISRQANGALANMQASEYRLLETSAANAVAAGVPAAAAAIPALVSKTTGSLPSPMPLPWVLNGRDGPVSIVHQYDRNPGLARAVLDKYANWERIGNEREAAEQAKEAAAALASPLKVSRERAIKAPSLRNAAGGDDTPARLAAAAAAAVAGAAAASPECHSYTIVEGKDVFLGLCDAAIEPRSATRPSRCCDVCDGIPSCRAFSWSRGFCYLKTCNTPSLTLAHTKEERGVVSGYRSGSM